MEEVVSSCIYCAIGCKLRYVIDNNKITQVLPVKEDEVSEGRPCVKGLTIHETVDKGRILTPMVRDGNKLKEISWEKAFLILYKFLSKYSADEIFFTTSGKITNEDNFIIQKFARLALHTNNIDSCCSRLCHMPTLIAFKDAFGLGASPAYINEVRELDCLIIAGSNPASNHPVLFNRIMDMKKRGGKIIVIAPILSETADFSDLFVEILPGSEILFFNTLINLIIERKLYKKAPTGLDELRTIVESYTPENFEKVTGVKKEKIYEVLRVIENAKKIGIIHGMGLTQHTNAVETIRSLINSALLLDAKILTNRGEINVQGSGDMLTFPMPLQFSEDVNQENLKRLWGENLPKEKGMNLIEAIGFGNTKVAFITHFNPAHSMPDLNRIHKNLKKMVIIQFNPYFNLTSNFAKLILPSPLLIEREGTITTGERRVRLVRKVRNPIGDALEEWKVYCKLAKMLDARGFEYKTPFEIFEEICKIVKAYSHVNAKKVYNGEDYFADKKTKFQKTIPTKFKGLEKMRSKNYPFLLFTFRSKFHFLTNEATGKSETLNKAKESGPFFYLNEEDAKNLKIKNYDEIIVKSKVGSLTGYAFISRRILKGYIGAHFHFENFLVNKLFPLEFDPLAFTPNFKCVAVKIVRKRK